MSPESLVLSSDFAPSRTLRDFFKFNIEYVIMNIFSERGEHSCQQGLFLNFYF